MSSSFATSWPVTCQAPLSMGFSRQEYRTGLPFPSLEHLPDPGLEPAFTGGFFTTEPSGNPHCSPLGFSNLFLSCLGQTPRRVGGGGGGGVGERDTESDRLWT